MDDCEELEHELDDLQSWYRWEQLFCALKALFSLFGLDWLIDVLRGRKTLGEAFGIIEALVMALLAADVYLVIQWIRDKLPELVERLGLAGAIGDQIKRFLGPIALAFLVLDLILAIRLFFECRELAKSTFIERAHSAYRAYTCDRKDQIFAARGIPIP